MTDLTETTHGIHIINGKLEEICLEIKSKGNKKQKKRRKNLVKRGIRENHTPQSSVCHGSENIVTKKGKDKKKEEIVELRRGIDGSKP